MDGIRFPEWFSARILWPVLEKPNKSSDLHILHIIGKWFDWLDFLLLLTSLNHGYLESSRKTSKTHTHTQHQFETSLEHWIYFLLLVIGRIDQTHQVFPSKPKEKTAPPVGSSKMIRNLRLSAVGFRRQQWVIRREPQHTPRPYPRHRNSPHKLLCRRLVVYNWGVLYVGKFLGRDGYHPGQSLEWMTDTHFNTSRYEHSHLIWPSFTFYLVNTCKSDWEQWAFLSIA